jgi:NADH-quinone oxidoreductase subunit M
MVELPILSILIFLPLVGALFIVISGSNNNAYHSVAVLFAAVHLIISCVLLANFDYANAGVFQFIEHHQITHSYDIAYSLGVDGLSLGFIVLSSLLTFAVVLLAKDSVKIRQRQYLVAFSILNCFVVGAFAVTSTVLFYIFFEAVLLPMFIIIIIWGGKEKKEAAFKLFLYTLAGSLCLLIALLYLAIVTNTTSMELLLSSQNILAAVEAETIAWLWWGLFVAFAVKMPMVPVHTWLPSAHVQAPTGGSVILAGVLLKMGAYGMLRFNIPLMPEYSLLMSDIVIILSIIAVIYASLVAFNQTDIKKLIAYSSVAHMGYVTAGLFSFESLAVKGAIIQMISHGIISSALFIAIGVIYDRLRTREFAKLGGLSQITAMRGFNVYMLIMVMASAGLPGTSGFIGEIFVVIGMTKLSVVYAILIAVGMVLSAVYGLRFYRYTMLGKLKLDQQQQQAMLPLTIIERSVLLVLSILTIFFGVYTSPLSALLDGYVANLGLIN